MAENSKRPSSTSHSLFSSFSSSKPQTTKIKAKRLLTWEPKSDKNYWVKTSTTPKSTWATQRRQTPTPKSSSCSESSPLWSTSLRLLRLPTTGADTGSTETEPRKRLQRLSRPSSECKRSKPRSPARRQFRSAAAQDTRPTDRYQSEATKAAWARERDCFNLFGNFLFG